MADCPDTRSWVEKAEEDARVARVLMESDLRGFASTIAFHCQQAAEKYLKACLVSGRIEFPKTHDFGQLITLGFGLSTSFEQMRRPTDRLQPYAVEARYPYIVPNEAEVKQALADMEGVRKFCRSFLGITDD
jgi:HEPN domain-containing protein